MDERWKDIKTAPKFKWVLVVRRSHYSTLPQPAFQTATEWKGLDCEGLYFRPNLWMPLPSIE